MIRIDLTAAASVAADVARWSERIDTLARMMISPVTLARMRECIRIATVGYTLDTPVKVIVVFNI